MPGPIALKLRDLRVQRGLTQKQAAELARVTPQTLIDPESGKRPPLHAAPAGQRQGARRAPPQEQAAELARVTPQTLIDLESGKRPPLHADPDEDRQGLRRARRGVG